MIWVSLNTLQWKIFFFIYFKKNMDQFWQNWVRRGYVCSDSSRREGAAISLGMGGEAWINSFGMSIE